MTQWTALALTLAIEVPIVAAWIKRSRGQHPIDWLQVVAVGAAATLLTHPIVWAFNTIVLRAWPFVARAAVVESFAVIVEAFILGRFLGLRPRQAALLSLVANGVSFATGLVLWALR